MIRLGLLLALVACSSKPSEQQPPPAPPPTATPTDADAGADASAWTDELEAQLALARAQVSQAYLAMKELRKTQAEGELPAPTGPLPALDFTRETGNAILSAGLTRSAREPITEEAQFRIVHFADDPWQIARGVGSFASDEERAIARDPRHRAALLQLARARYVVFVTGERTSAVVMNEVHAPARFDGIALLYELASTKLLAAIPLRVTGATELRIPKDVGLFRRQDPVVLDLEARAREALWAALKQRAPSVATPSIAYLAIDD